MDIDPVLAAGDEDLLTMISLIASARRCIYAQVYTGDSMSCTSLSICTSSETVISSSALEKDHEHGCTELAELTNKMLKRLDACSYACARRHSEKTDTGLWHHER